MPGARLLLEPSTYYHLINIYKNLTYKSYELEHIAWDWEGDVLSSDVIGVRPIDLSLVLTLFLRRQATPLLGAV